MKDVNINIIETEDNIFFKSDYEINNEKIDFNMENLIEIFDNIILINNNKNTISFNRESEKFVVTFSKILENIQISPISMLEALCNLFFYNKPIKSQYEIKNAITEATQKSVMYKLKNKEIPETKEIAYFNQRVDIKIKDQLLSIGQGACVLFNNSKSELILIGLVGTIPNDNIIFDVYIYQNDLKITIENCTIKKKEEISDLACAEIKFNNTDIKIDIIDKDKSLILNNSNLDFNAGDEELISTLKQLVESIGEMNDLDKLIAYSTENKKILADVTTIENDFLDDFLD